MQIAAYIIAVIIGISLGLIGGGGSILTVPVLVYLLNIDPLMATTYSLFIVGSTSLVGSAKAYTKRLIDFRVVALFGIPSILSIFIARQYLLPAIPDYLFNLGNKIITKDVLLMVVFALLMFVAAITMIRNEKISLAHTDLSADNQVSPGSRPAPHGNDPHASAPHAYDEQSSAPLQYEGHESAPQRYEAHEPNLLLVLPGLLIGLVTGLLGAGGGFLIIPTLVLIIRMPMKIAVGTSLLIIAINSLFGFVFSLSQQNLDWGLMLLVTSLAIVGIIIGGKLRDAIPSETLKKAFGWFVMTMGIYIIIKELWP